jgi:DNA-binding transcriptional ArsR family regulator
MSPGRQEVAGRLEKLLGKPEREVSIVDARAIRALAHDARQRVIDVLYSEQKPYTSTQLADLTGLTPSAMSYHLRALERWGVVERAEAEGDARNRPWRAAGTSIAVSGEGEAAEAAHDALRLQVFRALGRRMRRTGQLPRKDRANFVGLATVELWLTAEQTERMSLVVDRAIVELYEAGWVNEAGPGRTRMAFVWSLLPDPYALGEESEAPG